MTISQEDITDCEARRLAAVVCRDYRHARCVGLLVLLAVIGAGGIGFRTAAAQDLGMAEWKRNGFAQPRFRIEGTGGRNNPLRRKLNTPFVGEELFVRFRLRYDARTIDEPPDGNGEFLVLWMDQTEGGESSTHAGGIPNVGIHVSANENRFMARFGGGQEKFAAPMKGDQEYLVVARLWKSDNKEEAPFDQLSLWVDPKPNEEFAPHASVSHKKSPAEIQWIGFSTGLKTEAEDQIEVWDVKSTTQWRSILDLPAPSTLTAPRPPVTSTVAFAKDVLPILQSRCFKCHAGTEVESGIRLDIWDEVLNQTTPRNAESSRLYQLVASGEMPGDEPALSKGQLAVLRAWIDEGVQWDEKLLPTPAPTTDHWAFQTIRRPDVPAVENQAWVRTPVDAFIARRHEEVGLRPAPAANERTLQRRSSLGLLGLPLSTVDPKAKLDIGSLLSHPAYGENWGRHWLDVARWAESNGHQHNRHRDHAWRYRDWVIEAFNADLPYDEFIRKQLAGDEIEPFDSRNLIATGFLAAARYSGNELDKQIQRNDILVDITNTTASALLGLTLQCAQCHTHKFDPVTIRDYYRFVSIFAKGQPGNVVLHPDEKNARGLVEERWAIFDTVHQRMLNVKRKQGHPEPIYITPSSVVGGMKPDEKKRFSVLEKAIAELPQSWSFLSSYSAAQPLVVTPHTMRWPLPRDTTYLHDLETPILIRGDVKSPGPVVEPGWPVVFGPSRAEDWRKPRSSLARWMTDSSHPLTARVWVNRIWQWHFGRGLVATSNDFGTQGEAPTHPELLDFLADELMTHNWNTRHVHRLILNSSTYRQSSAFLAANAELDPDNRLLWRWTPRRLPAEAIRDSMLAVAGLLDPQVGGPSVDQKSHRRSLYIRQRRGYLPYQQTLFDGAVGDVSCSRRRVSTNSLQPLWMLNSDFVQHAAKGLAKRAGSISVATELAFGRPPTPEETKTLEALENEYGLASACLAILNASAFIYIN